MGVLRYAVRGIINEFTKMENPMFRCLTVLKILAIFFTLSVCHADEAYDQSDIDEINKILATQTCKPECTFALPSLSQLGNLDKATLKSLNFDVNSDGAPDYILESPANCGSSGCLKALLVSSNGKLGKVLEGRNIDQLSQDKNAIQKAYKNFRKPISNVDKATGSVHHNSIENPVHTIQRL